MESICNILFFFSLRTSLNCLPFLLKPVIPALTCYRVSDGFGALEALQLRCIDLNIADSNRIPEERNVVESIS